ncbi:MAG TPA: CPBP family intramembrane glutamic endopeptidase [Thermoplasmata archaeon]|nr:CPBP family intramembrane glutamic endopeptidase [Thermoplasmata archaeon]
MQCVRCGATFDGSFCPRCGAPAPATAPPAAVAAAPGWPCPRCGTVYRGHFCPRCGLPTAAWAYRPPPSPSGGRSVLSILWTLAMVGFLILALTDFAALLWSPTMVVPGIQGIQSGENVNSGLDFDGNWTFDQWGTGSSRAYQSAGGTPGGYIEMTLPAAGSRGFWWQAFRVDGSVPFAAIVRLDVQITGPLMSGRLLVSVDSSLSNPDPLTAIGSENFTAATAWTSTPRFDADGRLPAAGIYYLKVAFIALGSSGPVNVGFDNIHLGWTTDAGVFVYVPLPTPIVVYRSQDKAVFLAYYGLVVLAILVAGGYYAYADRKLTWDAIRAPLQSIGARLRSRSAWLAIAQVWMAVTFFQIAFILFLELAGISPTSPIKITTANAWVFLFELANAGVYEELAFRVLLIGLPMALGSVVLRLLEINRGGAGHGPGSAGRHVAGSLRYLLGGTLRADSPRETLVAAWAFLIASSAIFGLAHAPGWGWWKVIPAMAAGLGFGYLFLRHGIGAAMLAHFVNDYVDSLYFEGVGGEATLLLTELLVLGLAVAGAGFFAWYALHATKRFQELVRKFGPPVQAPPAAPVPPYLPPVPPPSEFPPPSTPSLAWPPAATSTVAAPVATVRDPARIPREYTPTYVPPPYGYPPVRFQCPNCAWVEARYDAGRFTCTRCGRTA